MTRSLAWATVAGVAWLLGAAQFVVHGVLGRYLFDPGPLVIGLALYGTWTLLLGIVLLLRPTRAAVRWSVAFWLVQVALFGLSGGFGALAAASLPVTSLLAVATDTTAGIASLAALVADRRGPGLGASLAALVAMAMLAACQPSGGSGPTATVTVVRITIADDGIRLDPASIPTGRVVLEPPAEGVTLASATTGDADGGLAPLDAELTARLRRGDYQGLTFLQVQGAFGARTLEVELAPGDYAFVLLAEDDQPGVPPRDVEVLSVSAAAP